MTCRRRGRRSLADEDEQHVWDIVAAEAQRQGFDPYAIWAEGAADPKFEVLRLDPWRVQDLGHGEPIGSSRVWHAHS
jgi:hypothetical protein